MPVLHRRRYESDSLVDPPDRRDGLSTHKCTAQRERETAGTVFCQGNFQSGWRERIWTHAEISNVVRQLMTSVREWLGNVWS